MAESSRPGEIGKVMPGFELTAANPEVGGLEKATRSLDDYASERAVVVVFTCNHCPYAKHVWDELARFTNDYADTGVALVAINSNDATRYADDSFERMKEEAQSRRLPFPYLHDEDQSVARAYDAACTPDVYVLDADRRLAYRGRLDATRPGGPEPDGSELRAAVEELLATGKVTRRQYPSVGCSIKWLKG